MIRVYVSHSIRGPAGANASPKQMQFNCDRIQLLVKKLREIYPGVDFYLPAEHEDFVQRAYNAGFLVEKEILAVDCGIVENCDLVIIFLPPGDCTLQGGRLVEYQHAVKCNIPVIKFGRLNELTLMLDRFLGI